MEISRREFLKDGTAAFGLGGWRLFAAPAGWKHGGKPNLVFGVVSDTHLRTANKGSGIGANWPDKMLDAVERLVKEYDMYYAIHNHGPDIPKLFPTAEAALKRIGSRDRRIGVCLDVGHEWRSGCDPVAFIRAHGDRIYDVHLKNIDTAQNGKKNHAMQGPRGGLDIPGIFAALSDVGYTGVCHIEYERDFKDNAMGLAESFGYYRGIAQMTQRTVK